MKLCPTTNQPSQDVVYTPEYLALDIFRHFNPKGKMLDPCRGLGAFHNLMPKKSDWCEIAEGVDFMDYDGDVDWVITNPPWSKIRQFYEKCFIIKAKNIVFLMNINAITTRARLNLLQNHGYGILEFYCVDNPKNNWPQTGFQLAAVHVKKDYVGPTYWSHSSRQFKK
jgi:hypothetical protein